MALQHLRSSTANKRPIPTVMSSGQIAINTNEASPGLFFKDSNGDLVKVGPVHIGTDAPNSSPASTAATALVAGTTYQILTVGTTDFTLVGASSNTVGVIFTATGAGTGDGTVSGQQGVEKGEQWLDTTGGAYDLKIYDGTAWRSQAGEFVNTTGDTMTGALLLDNAASAALPDLSFDGDADTGIYSPGADQVAIATGGTAAVTVDSSQRVGVGTQSPSALLHLNATTPVMRLTGTSAGNCEIQTDGSDLLFNVDSSNTQSSSAIAFRVDNSPAMRVDSSGRLLVGTTSSSATSGANWTKLEINNLDLPCALDITRNDQTVSEGSAIGLVRFFNNDNVGFQECARIQATADGEFTDNDKPTRLTFSTTADGASTPDPRMTIDSSGNVVIGDTTAATNQKVTIRATEPELALYATPGS